MGCLITGGITKSCEYTIAGIDRLYITNYDRKSTYTVDSDGYISDITMGDAAGKYFEIEFLEDTAYFQDDLTVSNNNKYRTVTIQVLVGENTINYLKQVMALDLGKFTVVMVDKSGVCNLLGRISGITATSNNYNSGTAAGDAKAWTLQFTGIEPEAHQLLTDESVVAKLVD